jgi:hypothetical protein
MTAAGRGHGQKRGRHEEDAIAALLSEPTVEAAAKRVGISESTLLRWMAGAIGRLQQASTQAVDALVRNLTCGIPAVEVGAAKAVFELTAKGMEQLDFAERLAAIEQVLGADLAPGGKP